MGRTIIVGDLHGCSRELERLLEVIGFRPDDDRVYFTGDLASRGPDPLESLAWVRRTGGRAVLGNHEDLLLQWFAARRDGSSPPRLGRSHRTLTKQLGDDDWHLLKSLPLWLDVPEHGLRIVHAGVLPGLPIEEQPRDVLLRVRFLDKKNRPVETREPKSGATLWGSSYTGPTHVVFGHFARAEPQLHPWATGIDTGAVYGNRLTALVLGAGERVPPPERRGDVLVSVTSERQYYVPRVR